MPGTFHYGTGTLTVSTALAIANGEVTGILGEEAIHRVKASHQHVQDIVGNNITTYGVNTGFGILSNTKISVEDTITLQHKILQSHSVGVGNSVPLLISKLMLITKVHALAKG